MMSRIIRVRAVVKLASVLALALCGPAGAAAPGPRLHLAPAFVSGTGGYHTYRIPALLVTPTGTLLAFCEGRKNSRSDTGDIDLLVKRSWDGGKTWSEQQVVWDDGANTCGNPCPVVDQATGTIWLPLTWNHGADLERQINGGTSQDTRRAFVCSSEDDGRTWSRPREITAAVKRPEWRWYATGPGVGIQLEQGPWKVRLLIPCDHTHPAPGDPGGERSHVIYSDDHGRTWQLGGVIGLGVNECQAVELADGTLMMNMRNYGSLKNVRAVATSTDGGLTWSSVRYDRTLVEPVCQASFLRYTRQPPDDRNRLLFANPAPPQPGRRDLTVRMSYDEGATWPVRRVLWAGPAAYSCLAILPDGRIACLFEAGKQQPYERLTFACFERDWLTSVNTDS